MDCMSNYTIIDYLRAHPELQKDAVLITDHCAPPMFFGGLPKIQRRLFKSTQIIQPNVVRPPKQRGLHRLRSGPLPVYDKMADTQSIKLVELALHSSYVNIMRQEQGMDAPCRYQDIDVDSSTFIFFSICRGIEESAFWYDEVVSLEHRLDQFTDAKWHVGSPVYFADIPEDTRRGLRPDMDLTPLYTVPGQQTPGYRTAPDFETELSHGPVIWSGDSFQIWQLQDRLKNLGTLRVEGVYTLPGGLDFPSLQQFCVVFNKEPPSPTRRPWIHKLTAPKLTTFTVHFNRLIPHFKSTRGVGSFEDKRKEQRLPYEAPLRTFELASYHRLDRSRSGISGAVPEGDDSTSQMHYNQLVLPFLWAFDALCIGSGVPISLFRPLDMKYVELILWHVNSPEDARLSEADAGSVDVTGAQVLITPTLHTLGIHVTGQAVSLPRLWPGVVDAVSFTSLSLDVSIHDCLGSLTSCRNLSIYSSPILVQNDPTNLDRAFTFTKDQWISFFDRCPSGAILSFTLIGFQMGSFLELERSTRPYYRRLSPSRFRISPVIYPVRSSGQGILYERATLKLSVLSLEGDLQFTADQFTITPIVIGDDVDTGFKLTLKMNAPVVHHHRLENSRCIIAVSKVIDEFILNGKSLEMVPTKDWEEEVKRESGRQYHKLTSVESHRWEIPIFLWMYSLKYIPNAPERFNHIAYNPYVRFPNDPKAYTAYHRTDYRSGWSPGQPPRYC